VVRLAAVVMMATTVVFPCPRRDVLLLLLLFSIVPSFLRSPACIVDCSFLPPFVIIPLSVLLIIIGSCPKGKNGLALSLPRSCSFVTGRRRLAPSFRRDSQCVCVHLSLRGIRGWRKWKIIFSLPFSFSSLPFFLSSVSFSSAAQNRPTSRGVTKKNEEGLRDMNHTPVHEPPPLNEEFAHLMQYLDT
jgi:hypothetical protein